MALARIITRSDVCSRALALDLLGRGYAVEIVTPDSIPTNMADLELRVEAALGDRLTASVIARDGDRSSTLEFVRNLKTSAADLAPLLAKDSTLIPLIAEPAAEVARPKVGALLAAPTASLLPAVALLGDAPSHSSPIDSILDREVSAPTISTPAPLPCLAEKPPAVFASASSMIAPPPSHPPTPPMFVSAGTDLSEDLPQPVCDGSSNHTPNLLRSATVVLTILALLMVMVFGMSVVRSGNTVAGTVAPMADKVVPSSAVPSTNRTSNHVVPHAQASKVGASAPAKSARVAGASSRKTISNSIVKVSMKNNKVVHRSVHNEDVIARDTVTYLDRSLEKATTSQSAKHPAPPHGEHGVVATNAATYLNGTSSSRTQVAPTPAK